MAIVKEILADNLALRRACRGFSRKRLAELTGLPAVYIKALEEGKKFPSAQKFQNLCNVLSCKPFELLLEGDEWESNNKIDNLAGLHMKLQEKIDCLLEDVVRRRLGL